MPEPVSDMNRNQNQELVGIGVGGGGGGGGSGGNGGFFGDTNSTSATTTNNFFTAEDSLEINMRNLENLSLLDNLSNVHGISGLENNENIAFFNDYDAISCHDNHNNNSILNGQDNGHHNNHIHSFLTENEDSKEPNVSRTVRVPTSEHVAEIVGRQGKSPF